MTRIASLLRISRLPILAGAALLSAACAGRIPSPVTTAQQPSVAAAPEQAPATSMFDMPDFWYSQHADAALLGSLRGGLLVVGFVDAACGAECALTLRSMKAIERETDNGVHFMVVSDVAGGGTPATLAAFAQEHRLSANRYTLASSTNESIAKLANLLDTRSLGATVSQFQRTSTLSVLDYSGIVVQQRGNGVIGPVLEAVSLLSNMR
ncbi:MAG: hypothetical protein ABI852_08615 [Gemmatimonadaceae bacterium]